MSNLGTFFEPFQSQPKTVSSRETITRPRIENIWPIISFMVSWNRAGILEGEKENNSSVRNSELVDQDLVFHYSA
jgi:hypothetical protein